MLARTIDLAYTSGYLWSRVTLSSTRIDRLNTISSLWAKSDEHVPRVSPGKTSWLTLHATTDKIDQNEEGDDVAHS